MGIVTDECAFKNGNPSYDAVAHELRCNTGLNVVSQREPESSTEDCRYSWIGTFSFASTPQNRVLLLATNCPEQGPHIRVEAALHQDGTLFLAVLCLLESMGGDFADPLDDEIHRRYGGKIDERQLVRNERRERLWNRAMLPIAIIAHLIWLPFLFLAMLALPLFLPVFLLAIGRRRRSKIFGNNPGV